MKIRQKLSMPNLNRVMMEMKPNFEESQTDLKDEIFQKYRLGFKKGRRI